MLGGTRTEVDALEGGASVCECRLVVSELLQGCRCVDCRLGWVSIEVRADVFDVVELVDVRRVSVMVTGWLV